MTGEDREKIADPVRRGERRSEEIEAGSSHAADF